MRVVFVHGACVRDGQWWWQPTGNLLRARGVESSVPRFPSCGETGQPAGHGGPGLSEDVAALRQVLRDSDEPTVVVAHSYGGVVTAEAAEGIETVQHILLIASFLPEVGQSLSSFGDGSPAPYLEVDLEVGVFRARPEMLADTFLPDCSPELAGEALEHLADQSLSVTQQPVAAAAWQSVPTTYLVCAQDRGTPPAAQRELARRADTVIEVDSGHHPFVSRPELVAELVATLA